MRGQGMRDGKRKRPREAGAGVQPRSRDAPRPDLTVGEFLDLWDRDRAGALRWYVALADEQFAALCRRVPRRDVAEDAIQEAFLVVHAREAEALRRVVRAASTADWHWRLLERLVHRRHVQRARRIAAFEGWARHGRTSPAVREPDEEVGPRSPGFSADEWLRVLGPVPLVQRGCLLFRLDGVSFRAMAGEEGISTETARRRVQAALAAIRHDVFFT